ncbi:hypothetical protein [Pseudactinotalea sp. HY158]|uniref:hypothetical protein n=1 Tax=Pseudactinotalea sp. HY158 TaxID=2654547 RepID=UPI00129CBD5D|nr:hypothetical protein [Pseudactinotalea sp. HY158]QGH68687.1 hypothetical protein GCE65_03625 [Pseudactinotalea sp. HY158]
MSSDLSRLSRQFFIACLFILLGSLALVAALEVLRSIWVPLAIGMVVIGGAWLFVRWRRRY